MKLLLCNIFIPNNNIAENIFDQEILKEIPFQAKITRKLPGGGRDVHYDVVAIPLLENTANESTQEEILLEDKLHQKMFYNNFKTFDVLNSVVSLFKGKNIDIEKTDFTVNVITIIEDYNITYTDGSHKKATNEASYGVVKVLNEDASGVFEDFTGKNYLYSSFSGVISDGTNNVGELMGLKTAVDKFSESQYQVIISDSQYSINALREWYYTWKDNGFKNYAKKPIANKELIIAIYEAIQNSNKIVMFKWVKGHSKKSFNEMCDRLAKDALGIE